MDLFIAFGITFLLLVFSVQKGIFLAYPLGIALTIFFFLAKKRGFSSKNIVRMAYEGGKKSFIVIKVFVLIGAIMAMWQASGTIPAVVYYGIKLLRPDTFILSAFLLSSAVSFLIGTAVGTSGTIGIALMVIAKSGGVNLAVTGGAIIAGAYFGDRCSPMSSSANLIAHLTETNIYENIKNMFKTSFIPFAISILFYYGLSKRYPMEESGNFISSEIAKSFNISPLVLLPVGIIIVFSLFKVKVRTSMMTSIIVAFFLAIFIQHVKVKDCIEFIFMGYSMEKNNPLYLIIKGGGLISMVKTATIVFITSLFAGLVEGTKMLIIIEKMTEKATSRYEVFRNVFITSIFTSAVGCSQTFSIMLTQVVNKKSYEKNKISNSLMAVDIENTAIVISALIPWNVALLAPMTILGVTASSMPYLIYLYILPIFTLFIYKIKEKKLAVGEIIKVPRS